MNSDPIGAFVDEFTAPAARNLIRHMTCHQIQAVAGMLTEHGQPESAQQWIDHHLLYCDQERPYSAHDTRHNDEGELATIDDAIGHDGQSYSYHRVVTTGDHTVRARIKRHVHTFQSYAVAEVLTPALTWTALAETTPSNWFEETPSPYDRSLDVIAALGPLAALLLTRARTILP
ncbi:hypothetical protein [Saccharopolyspora taberi]|uniref:Uncharacterized protein n=1 Tax=Saccharopolyspora taberi TaxID=60895 RepID=A0ABN3VP09_9PSEU